jgi:hypothetical protein
MKKIFIVSTALLVLIGLGYFIYSNLMRPSSPCTSLFEQTAVGLEEKIAILNEKGDAVLTRDRFRKLSDQSAQIASDLKTCCALFHDDKIDIEEFLKCQDEFNQYTTNIDRINHLVDEAEIAKQQKRFDLENLRLEHIERNLDDLHRISDHFQAEMKTLISRPVKENKKPGHVPRKSAITEEEPNDTYNQAMEISSCVLKGELSGDDRQDLFRFELDAGSILNLDFTPGEESENLKIALQSFEGSELWNSGERPAGLIQSTRMVMNSTSGGIYYAVVYWGSGSYKLDFFIEMQNDGESGTDAGDGITKALDIKPGRSYFGELGGFDEEDWYRFDVPAGHILNLAFRPNESAEPMKFSLQSFERSEIWYSGAVAPGIKILKRVMINNSSGGAYYLEASGSSGRYEFEIFTENQNDAGSETDAGDKMADALKVEPGHAYAGELGGYDEKDWYRFDILPGSILKMAFTTHVDGAPIKFAFRDAKRDEDWFTEVIPPGVTKTSRVVISNSSGGTYFLEAFYGRGSYAFEVLVASQNDGDSGTDAGDKITEALKIKSRRLISGELGGLDKEDWYTFSPQEGEAIEFTADTDGEPLKLSMGNVAHRKVLYTAELAAGVTRSFEIPKDVQPPYFLRVYGGSSKYSFEIR